MLVDWTRLPQRTGWLSVDERRRADAFRRDIDRRRYVAAHACLRGLLARYLGRDPASLAFSTSAAGKPSLPGAPLHFNLSHSARYVAVALSRQPVGVDVEERDGFSDSGQIAPEVLTPHELRLFSGLAPDHREARFAELWTAKEAVLKAEGEGFLRDPRTVEVGGLREAATRLGRCGDISWRLVVDAADVICSVAQRSPPFDVVAIPTGLHAGVSTSNTSRTIISATNGAWARR